MLRTTKPNCASNFSGSTPFSSKPGIPQRTSESPVRAANDSGGVVSPAGAAKCLMGAMGHLSCEAAKCSVKAQFGKMARSPEHVDAKGSGGLRCANLPYGLRDHACGGERQNECFGNHVLVPAMMAVTKAAAADSFCLQSAIYSSFAISSSWRSATTVGVHSGMRSTCVVSTNGDIPPREK